MIKKSLMLAAVLLVWCAVATKAQSQMTDEQVATYVIKENNKGTSQSVIFQNLLEKGVTTTQMSRVRKKYMSKNSQEELTGQLQGGVNRNRVKQLEEEAEEKKMEQHQDNFRRTQDSYTTVNDIGLYVEEEPDSLQILYDNFFKPKRIFGHDIFSQENLTFEPNLNMATPANYTLGAGDQVIVDVWGASQKTYDCTISPDGEIVIDEVGPIHLAGLNVQSAKAAVTKCLEQYYSGCNFNLSVGSVRTIQVQVVGEVEMPGTYSLSGFASAFNALYAAGGITETGTLRNIKVYRDSRVLAIVDVYDYLVNGNSSSDIRLQDKDIIVVGTYDCLVNVEGRVKRPMFYEMRNTESVKQLIYFTGGLSSDAYTQNVKLIRKSGSEYSIYTIDEFEMGGFTVMDGDEVYIDSIMARFSNLVEIRGAVRHAGQFQLGNKIQSVRELLEAADGLREDAYQERAIMHRQKDDLSLEMVSIDIKGIIDGTAADVPLKKNDLLFIPSKTEMRGDWTYSIKGEVIYPGDYPYADNTTLQDIILQAGGVTNAASMVHVDVYRRIANNQATQDEDRLAEHFNFSLDEYFNIQTDSTFYLKPFDEIYIRKSPGYEEQQNVTVNGCINFSGEYTMTKKDYRLSDLVKAAGGFTSLAYVPGARLTRKLAEEEKLQRDNAFRQAQIELYESSLQAENSTMDIAKADTLLNMKMNLDDTYPVAIDLDKAISEPGGSYDLVLREGDILTIPQFTNTVKVSGEVSYPISMNYKEGEKLKYYINHAGGFANRAKKKAIYIVYANGSVEKAEKGSTRAVQPGCEIVVPTKDDSRALSTAEMMSLGSSTASIAAMIVSILNIVN